MIEEVLLEMVIKKQIYLSESMLRVFVFHIADLNELLEEINKNRGIGEKQ
jgi:hypothetical protein